jgi:hypothetical protein
VSDTISQSQEAAGGGEDLRLILLDPRDNVLVARRAIAPGETVLKYGAPIGSATAPIAPGEHVHVHNVKSEYTPTYTLDDRKPGATA